VLLDWLDAAWSPLRWFEYSVRNVAAAWSKPRAHTAASCAQISAPLQFTVLLLASGDRLETDISSCWVLLGVTMAFGAMGEMVSRPNPDGETWQGDVPGKYFQSYAYRMIPFTIGCFPYFSAFAVIIRFYYRVIEDVKIVFEVDDVIPAYIYSALVAVLTTCFCGSNVGPTPVILLCASHCARKKADSLHLPLFK